MKRITKAEVSGLISKISRSLRDGKIDIALEYIVGIKEPLIMAHIVSAAMISVHHSRAKQFADILSLATVTLQ